MDRDILGKELQENLSNEGISIDFISIDKNKRTGVAAFIVSEGDNSIIVVPGATYNLTPSGDLLKKFTNTLIVMQGEVGATYYNGSEIVQVHGYKTTVTDTTGAGDPFNDSFGFAISKDFTFKEAIQFANASASLFVG